MDKIKLKSGREVELKDIGLDERDELLDSMAELENVYNSKGDLIAVKSAHKTVTKWMRIFLNGKADDDYILGFTISERTEFFLKMQEKLLMGEESASSSN